MIPEILKPHSRRQPDANCAVARIRAAEISLSRFTAAEPAEAWKVGLPAQDAFYLIVQLRDQPPHEYGVEGRTRPTPPALRGGLQIADLRTEPRALLREPFDSLNLLIPREALDDLADDAGASRIATLEIAEPWRTRDAQIDRLTPALLGTLSGEAGPLLAGQLLLSLAAHLCEAYGGLAPRSARPGGLAPWQERRARELIAGNLAREMSLAEVAAECRLSPWHFSRAFKASTGVTPHGWLQRCRIERARSLLRDADLSLAQVSQATGFADQSHFTRVFRRAAGISPGAWRRREARCPLPDTFRDEQGSD